MKKLVLFLAVLGVFALGGCAPGGAPDDDDDTPDPVSINIVEASASVEVGQTFQFHYSVANSSNTACAWNVNEVAGGNATVGTISAAGLYTAPAAVPTPATVTVKAVAAADTSKSDTAAVTVTAPPPFIISPANPTVAAGASQLFTTTADVDWSVEGAPGNIASLGTIGPDGVFTAPLSPPLTSVVTIVATSKSNPSLHAKTTAFITYSDASLRGQYAFTFRATDAGEIMFVGGAFTADGHGVITDGLMDLNSQARGVGFAAPVPFTGTYQVRGDGRALLAFTTATEAFGFRAVLASDASGSLIACGSGRTGAGDLERRDPASFDANLSGSFVFTYEGLGHVVGTAAPSGQPIAAAGRFTMPGGQSGMLADIAGDININGVWQNDGLGGASIYGDYWQSGTPPGSGLIGFNTTGANSWRYYILSADEALFVAVDWHPLSPRFGAIGRLIRQGSGPFSNASLSGDLVTLGYGYAPVPTPTPDPYVPPIPFFTAGTMTANGSGALTGGQADINAGGAWTSGLAVSGVYATGANGRGSASIQVGTLSFPTAFTMPAANDVCTVAVGSSSIGVSRIVAQASGRPFSAASLNGHYALSLRETLSSAGTDISGQILFNGLGDLAGIADVNVAGVLTENVSLSGTYTMDSTGRGTATISSGTTSWAVRLVLESPGRVLMIGTNHPSCGSLVRQY